MDLSKTPSVQAATAEMLAGMIENFEVAPDDVSDALIFLGDGADGPCLGYVETDGRVLWVVGG